MISAFDAMLRFVCLTMVLILPLSAIGGLTAIAAEEGNVAVAPDVDPAKVEGLVETLKDDEARAKLIEQLEALSTAQEGGEPEQHTVDEIGLDLVTLLTDRVNAMVQASVELSSVIVDLPNLSDWFWDQITNDYLRAYWVDLLTKLAIVMGACVIGRKLASYLLRPTIDRFYEERPGGLTTIVPLALLRGALRLLPIFVFWAIGYGLLTVLGGWNGNVITILGRSLVDASIFCLVLVVGARTVLAPAAGGLRLVKLDDDDAIYLFRWIRRFIYIIAYSYVIFQNDFLLKIPFSIYGGLERALGFVVVLMLIFLILQNRKPVAHWLRGNGELESDRVMHVLGRCRRLIADIWPVFAIFYIVSTYLIWALAIPGGFSLLFRGGVLTTFLLAIARPLAYGVERALGRGLSFGSEMQQRYPALERRINRYCRLLQGFAVSLVYFTILMVLVHIWGLDLFARIGGMFSEQTWSRLSNAATVLLISVVLWEMISMLIENYLDAVDDSGARVERSARSRTLLPLLRTFLFLLIIVMVTLTTLSTLGVDITPVLAAAGVIGIAIGFGSQKLVQDVINGLFILFQDTIAVGEVVDVAGHSGTVEHISVRTIGLRDLSGRVHTIPFSEVTTITNHTKAFAYAELDIGVGYREDVDEVVEVIRQIGAELETTRPYAENILEPIEVLGVDQFADSAVVIKALIKTRPMTQWSVKRGFNRLMKYRFDELGIEIPYPHQTIYFGEDKAGHAPAAKIQINPEDPKAQERKQPSKESVEPTSIRVVKDGNGGEEESHE
ncbi:MAG: mechanosensitive ion channel family protein [Geminicoccaceae bacterium]